MISISGIKYQKELEALPYFNKPAAGILIDKKGKNLDKKIMQLVEKNYLLRLKKGLYVSSVFVDKTNQRLYLEFLANIMRFPSYLSLEYALSEYGLIPEGIMGLTSVTVKSGRIFANPLGTFIYKSLKPEFFFGFKTKDFFGQKINMATPAKAIFDFLYLRRMENLKTDLVQTRINWDNLTKKDWEELRRLVKKSASAKMERIWKSL